jgi:tetraacyldisaccharide 4'-kinase
LFRLVAKLRKIVLQVLYQGRHYQVPVTVIGNISLGGSGKTPLLIALVKALSERGYRVAVISRGYGGSAVNYPLEVKENTPARGER